MILIILLMEAFMYSKPFKNCTAYPFPMCLYCPMRSVKKRFTSEEALQIAKELNIDFSEYDLEQFRMGLDVELEHGTHDNHTNVTNDDPILTGKIALAHLNEFPDYYTRLKRMEEEAEQFWGTPEE
jgi:hypothetical protein